MIDRHHTRVGCTIKRPRVIHKEILLDIPVHRMLMLCAETHAAADSTGRGQASPLVGAEATLSVSHTSCSYMLGNI